MAKATFFIRTFFQTEAEFEILNFGLAFVNRSLILSYRPASLGSDLVLDANLIEKSILTAYSTWNAYSKLDSLFGLPAAVGIFLSPLRRSIFGLCLIWRKLSKTLMRTIVIIEFYIGIHSSLKLIQCQVIIAAEIFFFDRSEKGFRNRIVIWRPRGRKRLYYAPLSQQLTELKCGILCPLVAVEHAPGWTAPKQKSLLKCIDD